MFGCDLSLKVPLSWRGPDGTGGYNTYDAAGNLYRMTYPVETTTLRVPCDRYGDEWDFDVTVEEDCLILHWCGELNYGWASDEETLRWLAERRIPFVASCDAKYEYDATLEFYDGNAQGERVEIDSSNAGPVLTKQAWQAMRAKWAHAEVGVIAEVDAYFDQGDLSKCDISHLPAEPPPLDEEETDDMA